MHALRILASCFASGQPLEADTVYTVPAQVGADDAEALVRMGRAVEADAPQPEKPTRTTRRKRHETAD